jgi:hypothetical protein
MFNCDVSQTLFVINGAAVSLKNINTSLIVFFTFQIKILRTFLGVKTFLVIGNLLNNRGSSLISACRGGLGFNPRILQ